MSERDETDQEKPGHGVIVRARNGDVIRYDPSGLVMRLSDKVIADIALRLGDRPASAQPNTPVRIPEDALEGMDAWNIRAEGDWLCFTARLAGKQGTRGFRRHVSGGHILGDTPGAVMGILGLGGPSAALATPGGPAYPHHIVAPADDIGAVGMAGIEPAPETDRLEGLRECTHEALVAETLLNWRMEAFAPLPLFVARAETAAAVTAADLSTSQAIANLRIASHNLAASAKLMGRKARIAAICLDYGLEDLSTDATAYRDGMLATMDAASAALAAEGFDRPLFVMRIEGGLPNVAPPHVLQGQWELAWNHGDHRLIHSAPSYMFARDEFDRPTDDARRQMAEMTAAAIAGAETWRCPILHLAELEAGDTIRVTLQCEDALVLDAEDPLDAGRSCGFRLVGDADAKVRSVTIAPDDPKSVIVKLDKPPTKATLSLAYAITLQGDTRVATGALRDEWSFDSQTGATLHRWALPALLPITGVRP